MNTQFLINNSFVKWTGSKRSFWKEMYTYIPQKKVYVDPFIGSGSILPYLSTDSRIYASDSNQELIRLWKDIWNQPHDLSESYAEHWTNLKIHGSTYYFEIRKQFNDCPSFGQFLFLTRTCVNGLIRYNSKGEFNSAFHHKRAGIEPDKMKKIIYAWAQWLDSLHISFDCCEYDRALFTMNQIASSYENTFIFLDPPYVKSNGKMYGGKFDFDKFYSDVSTLKQSAMITLDIDEIAGYKRLDKRVPGNSTFPKIQGIINKVSEGIFTNYDL